MLLLGAVLVVLPAFAIAPYVVHYVEDMPLAVVVSGLPLALFWWLLISAGRYPRCSFVGDAGFSFHKKTLLGESHDVVRFADVGHVHVSAIDHLRNGFYQGTEYDWQWRDRSGGMLFRFKFSVVERGFAAAGRRLVSDDQSPDAAFMEAAAFRWRSVREARAVSA